MDFYRRCVGSLLYLAINSRCNVCLLNSALGSHVADPAEVQINHVKHALRCLKEHGDDEMVLEPEHGDQMSAHTNLN